MDSYHRTGQALGDLVPAAIQLGSRLTVHLSIDGERGLCGAKSAHGARFATAAAQALADLACAKCAQL